MLKKILSSTTTMFGLAIRGTSKSDVGSPVEFSEAEREIVHHIMSNRLTMVSYERLWTTVMARKYVVDRDIQGDFVECGV